MITGDGPLPKAERIAELLKRPGSVRVDLLRQELTPATGKPGHGHPISARPAAGNQARLLSPSIASPPSGGHATCPNTSKALPKPGKVHARHKTSEYRPMRAGEQE